MAEKKKINIGIYDELHRKNLLKRAKQVQRLYKQAVQKITQKAQPTLFDIDPSLEEFHFSDFPQLAKAVNGYILQMGQGLQSNVEDGDVEAWTLANTKNDAVVNHMTAAYKIPRETLNKWKHPHLEALAAFMARKTTSMNLSDGGSREDAIAGVWNLKQFKEELELALETGIGQGKSAAELARDVKQYLKNPDKLFRRVRERVIIDKNGNKRRVGALRLSKAAAAYHPGQGVYRSSYKNALRLTATENNIAYRTADHQRWNALNFVLGQEVKLSNNHTLNGKPFVDICDDLAGKYPKTFKFTGWHPWCRCYATSILADRAEFEEYCKLLEQGKDVSNFKFTGMIGPEDAPEEFRQWVQDNKQRISKAKNMPYFLRDNPRLLESAGYKIPKEQHGMFDWDKAKPSVRIDTVSTDSNPKLATQSLLEKAAKRHAARTQEQIDVIQNAWNTKRLKDIDARAKEAEKVLDGTTSPNNERKALKKRLLKVKNAILEHRSPAMVETLYARYERGIDIQQRWDKIVWGGFSKEQRKNCYEIEKQIGILKGRKMAYEQADKQNANPDLIPQWKPTKKAAEWHFKAPDGTIHYVEEDPRYKKNMWKYENNCQTCAPAYTLREWGFNIKAGGNLKPAGLSYELSHGNNWVDTWIEQDGSPAKIKSFKDWMSEKGYKRMEKKQFRVYFDEITKEEGTYEIGLSWKGGGGHCTILKRFKDGTLRYVEPQHDNSPGSGWEWKDVDFLCSQITVKGRDGIMRVDNKLLNLKWASIFHKR